MYIPPHFAVPDAEVEGLIARLARRWAGVLVTAEADGTLVATHMPIMWDAEKRIVRGHVARANPHWKQGPGKGLIVLTGPEAYVTPGWYPSKAEHGKTVPTWNYEAVHFTGAVAWFDDGERLEALVRDLSAIHEVDEPKPWTIEDAPRTYIDALKRGFVGMEMQVERVEAKRKLSQNKSAADFSGVADGLSARTDPLAQEVGALMRVTRAVSDDPDGN
jgi:transcriptional regulator